MSTLTTNAGESTRPAIGNLVTHVLDIENVGDQIAG